MIQSKMLTISLRYKTKTNNVAEELKETLNNILTSKEFDNKMQLITKETAITIEHVDQYEVELIITMFATLLHKDVKLSKLMRAYIEENLTKLLVNGCCYRLIKRRVY